MSWTCRGLLNLFWSCKTTCSPKYYQPHTCHKIKIPEPASEYIQEHDRRRRQYSNRFKLELEVGEAVSSNNNDTDNSLNLYLEEQQQEEVQVPIAIATSLRPGTQPPKNSGCNNKNKNKKWIAGTILVVIVIVLGVTIGTSNTTRSLKIKNDPTLAPPTDAPTAKCNGEHLVEVMDMEVEEGNDGNAVK
eukprot:scaffold21207_cov198-Skeletonema_marinoi.AAC.14